MFFLASYHEYLELRKGRYISEMEGSLETLFSL